MIVVIEWVKQCRRKKKRDRRRIIVRKGKRGLLGYWERKLQGKSIY